MPFLVAFFAAIVLAIIAYHLVNRVPRLPRTGRDWGAAGNNDPRVAVAAMMYLVATEDGPLTAEKERRILALLSSTVGLGPELARTCLTGGKRLSRRLSGDLNARLHTLLAPIERQCSPEEKQEVIAMLRAVAGPSADRLGPVRDGLGRLTSSLLHG
jgi:uncharacterized tellurite resistance protein B-like protein